MQQSLSLPEITPIEATQRVINVIQKASTENDDIEGFLKGPVKRGEQTMKNIHVSLQSLSDTFRELNIYKGNLLERMFKETLVENELYRDEQDKLVKNFKDVPLMKPFEMR